MTQAFIPYGRQNITKEDEQAVLDVLRSDYLTTGPKVPEFEGVFAEYVGAKRAIAVANGTAALHLACLALGVAPGVTVLAPTMSFAASANGAAYCGAHIEFMDCDPDTGLVTPETFAAAADRAQQSGKPAKIAVIVHLNGEPADMAGISREAQVRGIRLIEDSCHALGTVYLDHEGKQQRVGNCRYSAVSCFSTHPVKTITTGEGGVITTQEADLADACERLRSHGIERNFAAMTNHHRALDRAGNPNPWYHEMQVLGFNYRLPDFACALGISQMGRMGYIAQRRIELRLYYDALFANSNLPVRTIPASTGATAVRHLYPVLIDYAALGKERSAFMQALKESGIGTQVHYIPIHWHPFYGREDGGLEGAVSYYNRVVSLPLYPELEQADLERVVEAIGKALVKPADA